MTDSLTQRLNEILPRITSEEFLSGSGLGNEIAFYIFDRVPVFRATSLDRELKRRPPEIPDYVRSQWERQGYRVSESPRLVPLESSDGRLMLLAVNRVTLAPVGRQSL